MSNGQTVYVKSLQDRAGAIVVKNHALRGQFRTCISPSFSGTISGSQPTGRGHTLTRSPLPGWRVAVAPTSPTKASKTAARTQQPEALKVVRAHLQFLRNCMRPPGVKTKIHIGRVMIMDR